MLTLLENFSPFLCEKNFVTVSPLGFNLPCLLACISAAKKYDGWCMRIGMFSEYECLLKSRFVVSSVKIQGQGHGLACPPLPTPIHGERPCIVL